MPVWRGLFASRAEPAPPLPAPDLPHGTDWMWRSPLWSERQPDAGWVGIADKTELAPGATLFHDCPLAEIALRSLAEGPPHLLVCEVFAFQGGFLSLAFDLPDAALTALAPHHVIALDVVLEMEKPIEIFARLNIRSGPNVEQILLELPRGPGRHRVQFDLSQVPLQVGRVTQGWLDLILDAPAMNRIEIGDVCLSRRVRAAL
ncbi:MAG: DUF6478 family protein [Rhodobacteraceae bacterium]|nr:DUF6478 family protein [Paracoccaceae bacterium]